MLGNRALRASSAIRFRSAYISGVCTTMTPCARSRAIAANASASSSAPATPIGCSATAALPDADSMSRIDAIDDRLSLCQRIARREILLASSSRSSSNRFAESSDVIVDRPVTLPPGCARLAARPRLTWSVPVAMTIGIFVVARRAASAAAVPLVTITSTLRRTRSCAIGRS